MVILQRSGEEGGGFGVDLPGGEARSLPGRDRRLADPTFSGGWRCEWEEEGLASDDC
jgi:hypothetical protein